MFNYNVGAPRLTRAASRASRIASANDLVQRTLSQHGLLPGGQGGDPKPLSGAGFGDLMGMAGTTSGQAIGLEQTHDTYACDAGSRSYHLYIPPIVTSSATSVVMMLHGCTQTGQDFAMGTGMNTLADEHGFVVVYPQQSRGDNAQSCWNWFSPGDQRRDRGEPAILAGLMRSVMADFEVPSNRGFVAGLSAGAAMAAILGEVYPDVFSAVGVHSGLPVGAATNVASAFGAMAGSSSERASQDRAPSDVRSIIFHGTADSTVHPSNAERIAMRAKVGATADGIETISIEQIGGRSVERAVTTMPCGSARVEVWSVDGLGHAWSGGQPGGSYTDVQGPDASAEMVRFFFGQIAS